MAVETKRGRQTGPFKYRDRHVIVTGEVHGVGAALFEVLAGLDIAHVSVLDVESPSGPHDAFLATDLSDHDSVSNALERIEGPVHALFSNAGVADTEPPQTVLSFNYLASARWPKGCSLACRRGEPSSTPRHSQPTCGASVRSRSTRCSTSASPRDGRHPCSGASLESARTAGSAASDKRRSSRESRRGS